MSGALILAAGFSRRFGGDKRLHQISCDDGQQRPMICATIRRYRQVFEETRVVLRAEDQDVRALLQKNFPGLPTITAAESHLGMGHSLAAGISAVSGWRYAFIGLADMPFVEQTTLAQLKQTISDRLDRHPEQPVIVVPVCSNQSGHPVGFSAHLFAQLERSSGDQGAKTIIREAGDALCRVPVNDPGVLQDVDQPD